MNEEGRDLVPNVVPRIKASNASFLARITKVEQAVFTEIIQKMLKNAGSTDQKATAS